MSLGKIEIVVDAGGSRVRAHGYVSDASIKSFEVRGSANPSRYGVDKSLGLIESCIDGLLQRLGPYSIGRVACGVAGAGDSLIRETIVDALSRRFLCDIFVCSDAESLLEAAAEKGPVTVLIAGTGAIAAGRRRDGAIVRAGGLGPASGDPGSGRWLAKRARVRLADFIAPETGDFEIGPTVDSLAQKGHEGATTLLADCASNLVKLLTDLKPESGPLITEGGLITQSPTLRRIFMERLAEVLPGLEPAASWRAAHWGALSLARRWDRNEQVWWA